MICDHRFPDDTLFMVFEEDYRFWPIGEDPNGYDDYPERLKKILEREEAPKSGAYRPDKITFDAAASGAKGEQAKGISKGYRVAGQYHFTPNRQATTYEEDEGLCQEVADLIRIATLCHRNSMGEIIWFGWEPKSDGKRPTWLWKASHGLMLTKKGAHHIEVAMQTDQLERNHFDLAFSWWLRRPHVAEKAGVCYIVPSIGSYFAHPSDCDPLNFGEASGGRPDGWDKKVKPARGTRQATDQLSRPKWIAQWKGTGQAGTDRVWIPFPKDGELHSHHYKWMTYKEEPTASLPPPPPAPAEGEVKQEEASEPQQQVAVPRWTKRQERIWRDWNLKQRYRAFTNDVEKAAPPITLFYFLQSQTHSHTCHCTALEPTTLPAPRPTFCTRNSVGLTLQMVDESLVLQFHVQTS